MKVVIEEPESAALRQWLKDDMELVSSTLSEVEVPRAIRRSAPGASEAVPGFIASLLRVEMSSAIRRRAAGLPPPQLRSLDAIHLATALDLGIDLEAIVTYDSRLAGAAREHGLTVAQPGR